MRAGRFSFRVFCPAYAKSRELELAPTSGDGDIRNPKL